MSGFNLLECANFFNRPFRFVASMTMSAAPVSQVQIPYFTQFGENAPPACMRQREGSTNIGENMKKQILSIAVVGALAAASGSAVADEPGAFFINGNLGQSTYHDSTFSNYTDTSGAIRAGYSWQSDVVDFGVEAGYVDLGTASTQLTSDLPGLSEKVSAKASGPLLGLNLKYKFQNHMFVSARGGLFHSSVDVDVGNFGSERFHGNGGYLGAAAGYDFNQHFSLGLAYDGYHARIDSGEAKGNESIGVFSGFAEYRF